MWDIFRFGAADHEGKFNIAIIFIIFEVLVNLDDDDDRILMDLGITLVHYSFYDIIYID
jgi:hypothetical protein